MAACTFLAIALLALPASAKTVTVNVGPGIAFSPNTITINVGDSVNWVWQPSSIPHSTTSGACSGGCVPDGKWDSGVMTGSGSFSHTFTSAGPLQAGLAMAGLAAGLSSGAALDAYIQQLGAPPAKDPQP